MADRAGLVDWSIWYQMKYLAAPWEAVDGG